MTPTLPPYPEYKDSGIEWLGRIPAHWEVQRLRNVVDMRVSNVDKNTNEGELPVRLCNYVDVYKHDRITSNVHFMKATATQNEVERFRLQPGDILITKDSESWNDIGVPALVEYSADDLICGYHLALLRPRASIRGEYLLRVLQGPPIAYQFHVAANGITRYGLTHTSIKTVTLPVPPLPERRLIARYLDWADARIRRLIGIRQRQIKLLEEYRQALIQQAVTGQIDVRTGKPYPAYKDSGIEWLGRVPSHWEVRRLKQVAKINPGRAESRNLLDENGLAVFLPMEKVSENGTIDTSDIRSIALLWNGFTYFKRGDVIVAKITPCFENGKGACLTQLPTEIGFGSTEFHVLRPNKYTTPEFLYLITRLSIFRKLGVDQMTGAAGQQRVPSSFVSLFQAAFPSVDEQHTIVTYLNKRMGQIDAAVTAARRAIELLREYRTRLIADVVTGKADVRAIAARLPDAPPDAESPNEEEIPRPESLDDEAVTVPEFEEV